MKYIETELTFTTQPGNTSAKATRSFTEKRTIPPAEVLGIRFLIGDQPLVYNLRDLAQKGGKTLPDTVDLQSSKDYYLVVHAISAIRTQGHANVEELQYYAIAQAPATLQTVDLVPKTRFNELLKAGVNLECSLDLLGEISPNIPASLLNTFMPDLITLGENLKFRFSTSASIIGKFIYSLQIPVVQSAGIGSTRCSWILKPDEKRTPLLGDQLLVQSIAVPKGTTALSYTVSGLVKADRGIFWRQHQQQTPEYTIDIALDKTSLNSQA